MDRTLQPVWALRLVNIPFSGLTGPVLNFANQVQRAFDGLLSVALKQVPDVASLPNPDPWKHRQIIVTDIDGAGTFGVATSDGTDWRDAAGNAL